jgi:hypothetical protein
MATDTEQTERAEPDLETTMDGGLCRLDVPGATLEEDEVVAPRHARDDD